jgi:hypothetical protein
LEVGLLAGVFSAGLLQALIPASSARAVTPTRIRVRRRSAVRARREGFDSQLDTAVE